MKYLDRIANIAVIVAVVALLVVILRGEFGRRRAPAAPTQSLVGKIVSLPGVQFPKDRSSLLLVVSTSCHFCKDSLPFYKKVTEELRGKLNVIAVLPQSQPEAQEFLRDAGVEADQIVSASVDKVGARGTPTLLLVGKSGAVEHEWLGKLDVKGQQEVLSLVAPKS
jgi:thioredoxin-related protein